jgi:murein DD-endopeptidase MepM/ murein hydrolase activator NlpD
MSSNLTDMRSLLAPAALAATALAVVVVVLPSVTATHAQAPGCGDPARVVAESTTHGPRIAEQRLRVGETIAVDAEVRVPLGGWLRLSRRGASLRLGHGAVRLECAATRVVAGRISLVAARSEPSRAMLATPEAAFTATVADSRVEVAVGRRTRIWVRSGAGRVVSAAGTGPLETHAGDAAVVSPGELPRLDTWPFADSGAQRPARPADHLPAFWADGAACSVGCRPVGARDGWPLRPFHQQHPLRAGLNERRPANMHKGVDIQAQDGTPVYAMQPGTASVVAAGTPDERVQVGNYLYWHVRHRVQTGQFVSAYHTVVGTIINGAGHLHLSELSGALLLNPLRPGGRVLSPWTDTQAPVIGLPQSQGGRVTVQVFDPQSFRALIKYRTPVLAPAALAYRAWDAAGRDVTGLQFALRGSQHLPDAARWVVYAGDAYPPGWTCFDRRLACRPHWNYRLAGGLAPPLPPTARRLSIYAWDWAGNRSVREVALR